jgi:hypothetical protein
MAITTRSLNVDGQAFDLSFSRSGPDRLQVQIASSEPALEPLCQVAVTAFAYDPARFVEEVASRQGHSFEGEVAFCFADDAPDEIPAGHVSFSFLDESVDLAEPFVRDFTRQLGQAYLEVLRDNDLDSSALQAALDHLASHAS